MSILETAQAVAQSVTEAGIPTHAYPAENINPEVAFVLPADNGFLGETERFDGDYIVRFALVVYTRPGAEQKMLEDLYRLVETVIKALPDWDFESVDVQRVSQTTAETQNLEGCLVVTFTISGTTTIN